MERDHNVVHGKETRGRNNGKTGAQDSENTERGTGFTQLNHLCMVHRGAEEGHDAVWQWTPEQSQQYVNTVHSGQDLTPKHWPEGAKVAVSLSFDLDTEPVPLAHR